MPGLRADVRVRWTEGGIPHLDAASARDLLFAQGYVTAAERFFQMDFARRLGRGELAEILGDRPAPWEDLSVAFRGRTLVDLDHFLRQLALAPVARASLDALEPEARALVEAYASGVNAWLAEGGRPLECQLLGYRPRPWTAADSALLWKSMAFQLCVGWRAGLAAEALRARFPGEPEKVRALLPDQSDVADVMHPAFRGAGRALKVLEGVFGKGGPGGPALGGSNAWAVGPSRSANGRAILCGDPHLPANAPTPGYLIHLRGGDFDVAGWSAPGIPGVLMGHNERMAWTVTSGSTIESTWALEQFGVGGDSVRTADGFAPVESEQTNILVRGKSSAVRRTLRFTSNGPLFDADLLGSNDAGFGLALRWTGHLPTRDLEAVLKLDRARSVEDLHAAASLAGAPTLNVVHADVDGHIGWRLTGLAPRFRGKPTAGVVPAWEPALEWEGLEPPESMPHLVDPPDGRLVSANQRLLPTGSVVQLGELFEPPWRARRIRARLEREERIDLPLAADIQLDRFSGFGSAFVKTFVRPLAARRSLSVEGRAAEVLRRAAAWDGLSDPDSQGAASAWAFAEALMRVLFEEPLGERLYRTVFEQHNLPLRPFLQVLERKGAPFVSEEGLEEAAVSALSAAADRLVERCGPDPASWRLGRMRPLVLRHPLGDLPLLGRLFRLGPVEFGGDGSTVSPGFFRLDEPAHPVTVVAAMRHAVECGEWDGYRAILATGQSGDPTSGRYRDHLPRWAAGGFVTIPFSEAAIEQAAFEHADLAAEAPKST